MHSSGDLFIYERVNVQRTVQEGIRTMYIVHAVNVPYLVNLLINWIDYLLIQNCQTVYLIKLYLYRLFAFHFYVHFWYSFCYTAQRPVKFISHARIENQ